MAHCSTLFWDFSLQVYSAEHVSAACIELQDRIGLDVNVLLLALLAAAVKQRTLTKDELIYADQYVRQWHDEVVKPIRVIRRRLKSGVDPVPVAVSEPLRDEIKKIELRSEYLEQQALAAWFDQLPAGGKDSFNLKKGLKEVARAVVAVYGEELVQYADTVSSAAAQVFQAAYGK